jgi:enterochelin esterase-like enzyme
MVVTELTAEDLPRSIPFRIYLPPCFLENPSRKFPALYLLHGLQATDEQWDLLGVDETALRLIQAGRLPPFLIVMPWERRGLEFETAVADHLVPYVEEVYRADPLRASRAIGGLSRGAGWAARIGLQRPQDYVAVGMHSPAVISPDMFRIPLWLGSLPPQEQPRVWVDIGERDSLRKPAEDLVALLEPFGLDLTWTLQPGDHTPAYWTEHIEEYLTWYGRDW